MRLGATRNKIQSDLYIQRFAILDKIQYDVILGQDFLINAGVIVNHKTGKITVTAIDHSLQIFVPQYDKARAESVPVTYSGPTIGLPPGTIIPVVCQAGRKGSQSPRDTGFFEPSTRHKMSSHVRPAAGPMTLETDGRTEILVLNTANTPQALRNGTILGRWINIGPASFPIMRPQDTNEAADPLLAFSVTPETDAEGTCYDVLSFRPEPPPPPPPPNPPPDPPPDPVAEEKACGKGDGAEGKAESKDDYDQDSFQWPRQPEGHPSSLQHGDADVGPEELDRVLNMTPEEKKQKQLEIADSIDLSKSALTEEQKQQLRALFREFFRVWAIDNLNPQRTHLLEYSIPTGTARPLQTRPYRVSLKENIYIAEQIKQMSRNGIIRHSTSAWSRPVVLAPKPGGGLRFCVDYRKLNSILPDDRRPLPLIQDILDGLLKVQKFSHPWIWPPHIGVSPLKSQIRRRQPL